MKKILLTIIAFLPIMLFAQSNQVETVPGFYVEADSVTQLNDTTYRVHFDVLRHPTGAYTGLDMQVGDVFYSRPVLLADDCNKYIIDSIVFAFQGEATVLVKDRGSPLQGFPNTGINAVVRLSASGFPHWIADIGEPLNQCMMGDFINAIEDALAAGGAVPQTLQFTGTGPVTLDLSGTASDVVLTEGTNITFSSITSSGLTINSSYQDLAWAEISDSVATLTPTNGVPAILNAGDGLSLDVIGNTLTINSTSTGNGSSINIEEYNIELIPAADLTGIDIGRGLNVINDSNEADLSLDFDTISSVITSLIQNDSNFTINPIITDTIILYNDSTGTIDTTIFNIGGDTTYNNPTLYNFSNGISNNGNDVFLGGDLDRPLTVVLSNDQTEDFWFWGIEDLWSTSIRKYDIVSGFYVISDGGNMIDDGNGTGAGTGWYFQGNTLSKSAEMYGRESSGIMAKDSFLYISTPNVFNGTATPGQVFTLQEIRSLPNGKMLGIGEYQDISANYTGTEGIRLQSDDSFRLGDTTRSNTPYITTDAYLNFDTSALVLFSEDNESNYTNYPLRLISQNTNDEYAETGISFNAINSNGIWPSVHLAYWADDAHNIEWRFNDAKLFWDSLGSVTNPVLDRTRHLVQDTLTGQVFWYQGESIEDSDSSGYNTTLVLNGTTLELTDDNKTLTQDLSSLQDGTGTDDQDLEITGSGPYSISIEDGNQIPLSAAGIITISEPAANILQIGATEVDGSVTNEIQSLTWTENSSTDIDLDIDGTGSTDLNIQLSNITGSVSGNVLTLTGNVSGGGGDGNDYPTTALSSFATGTGDLTIGITNQPAAVINLDGRYLQSEVDGSTTNEINTNFQVNGANLEITDSGGTLTVPISSLQDGFEANSDDQTIDVFNLNGSTLELSLEDDGEVTQTVNLSSIDTDTHIDITSDGSTDTDATSLTFDASDFNNTGTSSNPVIEVNFPTNNDNDATNEFQTFDVSQLVGTDLQLSLSDDGEATKVIDLSSLQDGTGTDNQQIDQFAIVSNELRLELEDDGQAVQTVDLSPYLDNTDTQLTDEEVEDITGAMVSSNTETLIDVAYQDVDGTFDFVVENDLSQYDNSTSGFITDIDITVSDGTNSTVINDNDQITFADANMILVEELNGTITTSLDNSLGADGQVIKKVGGVWTVGSDNVSGGGSSDGVVDAASLGSSPNYTLTLSRTVAGDVTVDLSPLSSDWTIEADDANTEVVSGTIHFKGEAGISTAYDAANNELEITNDAPDQTVTLTDGGTVSITGTYPNFTITGTDTNTDEQEIADFSLNNDILSLEIENDGQVAQTVDLSAYMDNTDDQTLSWNAGSRELSIESGNTVTIADEVDDADADPANEVNTSFQVNAGNLEITDSDGTLSATLADINNDYRLKVNASETSPNYLENQLSVFNASGSALSISTVGNDIVQITLDPSNLGLTDNNFYLDGLSWNGVTAGQLDASVNGTTNQSLQMISTDVDNALTVGADNALYVATVVDTDTQLSQEEVEDFVDGLISDGDNTTVVYTDNGAGAGSLVINVPDNNDNSSTNEIQDITWNSGTRELSLSSGSTVTITDNTGTDNQQVDQFDLIGNTLTFQLEDDGQAAHTVDLSSYLDNTDTQLTEEQVEDFVGGMLIGTQTNITVTYDDSGNAIDFVVPANNDNSSSNELQSISWNSGTRELTLSDGGGTVTITDDSGTDDQTLSLVTNTLSIEDGNSVNLSGYLDNTDEQDIDKLNLNGTTLEISMDNVATDVTVDLSSLQDGTGTDDQKVDQFELVGNTLTFQLENDGQAAHTVDLSSYLDDTNTQLSQEEVEDFAGGLIGNGDNTTAVYNDGAGTLVINVPDNNDNSASNELQTLSWSAGTGGNDEITLSNGGGTVTITDNINDADASSTNELQNISWNAGSRELTLDNGGGTVIIADNPGTDNQNLTLTGSGPYTLNMEDGADVIVDAGTGISLSEPSANTLRITNSDPDQTVSLTGAGITSITGTYPNFTITSTEVDGSTSNELQTLSDASTTGGGTVSLSDGGGSFDVVGTAVSYASGVFTIDNDGFEANTDNQKVDKFNLNGTTLELALEDDGEADYTVDLSSLSTTYTAGDGLNLQSSTEFNLGGTYTSTVTLSASGASDFVIDATGVNQDVNISTDQGTITMDAGVGFEFNDANNALFNAGITIQEQTSGGIIDIKGNGWVDIRSDADVNIQSPNFTVGTTGGTSAMSFTGTLATGNTNTLLMTVDGSGNVETRTVASLPGDDWGSGSFDIDGDSGSGTITEGETFTIAGGGDVTTSVSGNTATISFTETAQTLSDASTSGGGSVSLSDGGGSFDIVGNAVTYSSGVFTINGDGTGTDDQDLSYIASMGVVAITNGNNATIPVYNGTRGLVPDADGSVSNEFLREDGTWAVPTDNDTQLTDEEVEDIVGLMTTGNTESGIIVSYQDATGNIDFQVIDDRVNIESNDVAFATNLEILDFSDDFTVTGNAAETNVSIDWTQSPNTDTRINVTADGSANNDATSITFDNGHFNDVGTDGDGSIQLELAGWEIDATLGDVERVTSQSILFESSDNTLITDYDAATNTLSIRLNHLGLQSLSSPISTDYLMGWDASATSTAWMTIGSGLTLTGTTLTADGDDWGNGDLDVSGDSGSGSILNSETFSIVGSGIASTSMSGNTMTITATEVDGSTTNESWKINGDVGNPAERITNDETLTITANGVLSTDYDNGTNTLTIGSAGSVGDGILFWDDSDDAGEEFDWLYLGSGLSISNNTMSVDWTDVTTDNGIYNNSGTIELGTTSTTASETISSQRYIHLDNTAAGLELRNSTSSSLSQALLRLNSHETSNTWSGQKSARFEMRVGGSSNYGTFNIHQQTTSGGAFVNSVKLEARGAGTSGAMNMTLDVDNSIIFDRGASGEIKFTDNPTDDNTNTRALARDGSTGNLEEVSLDINSTSGADPTITIAGGSGQQFVGGTDITITESSDVITIDYSGSGGSGFTSFDVSGDGAASVTQTITDGNTLAFEGHQGIEMTGVNADRMISELGYGSISYSGTQVIDEVRHLNFADPEVDYLQFNMDDTDAGDHYPLRFYGDYSGSDPSTSQVFGIEMEMENGGSNTIGNIQLAGPNNVTYAEGLVLESENHHITLYAQQEGHIYLDSDFLTFVDLPVEVFTVTDRVLMMQTDGDVVTAAVSDLVPDRYWPATGSGSSETFDLDTEETLIHDAGTSSTATITLFNESANNDGQWIAIYIDNGSNDCGVRLSGGTVINEDGSSYLNDDLTVPANEGRWISLYYDHPNTRFILSETFNP